MLNSTLHGAATASDSSPNGSLLPTLLLLKPAAKSSSDILMPLRPSRLLDNTESKVKTPFAINLNYSGYPTIKIFYPDGRVEDYNGGRTADDIVAQAMILFEDVAEPPELFELTNKDALDKACTDAQVNICEIL